MNFLGKSGLNMLRGSLRIVLQTLNFIAWLLLLWIALPVILSTSSKWAGIAFLIIGTLILSGCNWLADKMDEWIAMHASVEMQGAAE